MSEFLFRQTAFPCTQPFITNLPPSSSWYSWNNVQDIKSQVIPLSIITQMDDVAIINLFQKYFRHLRPMREWLWSALCSEAPFRFGVLSSSWTRTLDPLIQSCVKSGVILSWIFGNCWDTYLQPKNPSSYFSIPPFKEIKIWKHNSIYIIWTILFTITSITLKAPKLENSWISKQYRSRWGSS